MNFFSTFDFASLADEVESVEENHVARAQTPPVDDQVTIAKNPIKYLNQLGNFLIERAHMSHGNEQKGKQITDEDFKAVVQEVRHQGYVTHAGVKHVLEQEATPNNVCVNFWKKETCTNKENPKSLFDGKENFLSEASRKAAEGSEEPVLRRGSSEQKILLGQVSMLKWDNMSERWHSDSVIVDDDNGSMKKTSLKITDILNDSMLSIDDEENKSYNSARPFVMIADQQDKTNSLE